MIKYHNVIHKAVRGGLNMRKITLYDLSEKLNYLMNLLCKGETLAHDEGICQKYEGPHANLGV